MKFKTILVAICIACTIASCNKSIKGSGVIVTSIRPTEAFTGIVSNGSFNVYVTESATREVKVIADDNIASHIETSVSNGILRISFKNNVNIKNSVRTDIYISSPAIQSIDLEGSGNIQTTNRLKSKDLTLIINGSGKVIADDSCGSATVRLNGSGSIALTGTAKNQTVSLSGSGNINASGFHTENTTVDLSGSGSATVFTTTNLNAKLSGSGSIFYYGNPPTVNKNVSGSGVVGRR